MLLPIAMGLFPMHVLPSNINSLPWNPELSNPCCNMLGTSTRCQQIERERERETVSLSYIVEPMARASVVDLIARHQAVPTTNRSAAVEYGPGSPEIAVAHLCSRASILRIYPLRAWIDD